jgi:mannose-6-phosphate isomerase-like protein (cupin superfamily)
MSRAEVVPVDELEPSSIGHELMGEDHAGVGISLILIDAPPGRGPRLHRHAYAEVFVVQEGQASFSLGDEERTVTAGHVVIVPAGEPHGFTSSGVGPLRQVAIHLSPRMVTEWLEDG